MAFTRKMLRAMGIEDDKIEQIVDAHIEVVNSLKDERDTLQEKVDTLVNVEKELNELKADGEGNSWQEKYDEIKAEYDSYKAKQEEEKHKQSVIDAYKTILKKTGVSEKRIDSIIKITDFKNLELNNDGTLKDAKKIEESVKTEWADFIVQKGEKGADVSNPPEKVDNSFEKMSLADKMRYANEHPNDANVQAFLKK